MRRIALILLPLLWTAAASAQVPLPAERPLPTDEAASSAADEAAAAKDAAAATEEGAEKPGRVIRIEIIGEKKPVPAYSPLRADHPARQAELAAQRQRLIEARRRREQQERARRVGNALRQQPETFRRRPTDVQ